MLSEANHHRHVPKELKANVKFRLFVLKRAKEDKKVQSALLTICKEDILFWINTFVFQYNPRHNGAEVGPFITWEFQDAAILATLKRLFHEQDDALWEKSRELGATWLALLIFDWLCLFHRRKKFIAISHSEDAVDRSGDPDSLFWKLDFIHEHLPNWMQRGVVKKKLGFRFPGTDSSFNGAANTERAGVGGRATAVLLDEFSKHPKARDILGQTADTGPRLFIGTHYGTGTEFYDLTRRPDLFKIVMHWTQHPEKNRGMYTWDQRKQRPDPVDKQFVYTVDFDFVSDGSPLGGPFPGIRSPWYDRECRRRASERDVAMHLDIDPAGSVSQFFSPMKLRQLIEEYCLLPYWRGDLRYDRDLGVVLGFEPNENGPLKLWCHLDHKGQPPEGFYGAGADISWGTGATPSCFAIGSGRTGEKVLEYTNAHIAPDLFSVLCVALCRLFHGARFVWEMQGPGVPFGRRVVALGYSAPSQIYYRQNETMPEGFVNTSSEQPGWVPTGNNTKVTLEDYRTALASGEYINRSAEAMKQCLEIAYLPNGGIGHNKPKKVSDDPAKARESHADMVVMDALTYKMMKGRMQQAEREEKDEPHQSSLAWRMKRAAHQLRAALWT